MSPALLGALQQQKHSVLAVQKTLFSWEDAAIYSDKMLFPACISAGRAALQPAPGPQSHLEHQPEVPTGAASPSLSPSLPTAAADSSSLLHADPTSPCPNHSPTYVSCTQGSPRQTLPPSLRWLCVDGQVSCTLHPIPVPALSPHALKSSFAKQRGCLWPPFLSRCLVTLHGTGRCTEFPRPLPDCLHATEGGSCWLVQAGAQPLQHSPTLTPSKASPPPTLWLGPPWGAPLRGCWGFPSSTRRFVLNGGQQRALPRHPEQLQGRVPALAGCVPALRGPWALCSPGRAQIEGAGEDMSPGLSRLSFPPAFWQGAGSRA